MRDIASRHRRASSWGIGSALLAILSQVRSGRKRPKESLSQRDREALQLKTTKLGAVEVEKEEDDDDLDAIAKQFGYDDDEQVDFSSSYFPKEGSKHESTVNTISYIKPVPSQILTVHDNMNIIHLDLDSGCWVSCAQLDYVKEKGWEILPNGQLT